MFTDYSTSTTNFPDRLRSLQQLIDGDTPDADTNLGVGLTEYNVRTAGDYDTMPKTLDDPYDSSCMGAISTQVALALPAHMYAFKFAQTQKSSGSNYPVVKNGLLYVDNTKSVGQYGGTTKAAEIWRLFVRAAQPGRVLRNCALSSDIASFSSSSGIYCMATTAPLPATPGQEGASSMSTHMVYIVNSGTLSAAVKIDLDLSSIVPPSSDSIFAFISEVSPTKTGATVWSGILPSTRVLAGLTLPASAAWLLTTSNVPVQPSGLDQFHQYITATAVNISMTPGFFLISATGLDGRLTIAAQATAVVRDGVNANTVQPSSASLTTRSSSASSVDQRSAAYMRFSLPNVNSTTSRPLAAHLRMCVSAMSGGATAPANPLIAHLYALSTSASSAWSPSTIKWSTAPGLKSGVPASTIISGLNHILIFDLNHSWYFA
jgi:hypothetical protein